MTLRWCRAVKRILDVLPRGRRRSGVSRGTFHESDGGEEGCQGGRLGSVSSGAVDSVRIAGCVAYQSTCSRSVTSVFSEFQIHDKLIHHRPVPRRVGSQTSELTLSTQMSLK